jgi:hypothetical protein
MESAQRSAVAFHRLKSAWIYSKGVQVDFVIIYLKTCFSFGAHPSVEIGLQPKHNSQGIAPSSVTARHYKHIAKEQMP